MKVKEIIGEGLIDKAIKGGAALTGLNLLTDPGSDKWSAQGVGRALAKTGGQVKDFVGGVYRGLTGADKAAPAADAPASDSPQSATTQRSSDAPSPAPAPVPEPDTDNYIQDLERRVNKNQAWPAPSKQNESSNLKKKHSVTEADKRSSFELEIEKNFSDPYVRKAIMAKARQESGGRNIGEMDWTRTSNKNLKAAFPQLKNLDDTQLNNLKAQGNTVFLDYAYKGIGGYKYRGRGPIQITGKGNYEKLDKQLGLNGALVKDPDMLLKDPALANTASVQYLKNAGLHNKTFNDQRSAHQGVIYAIGGSLYAPGSERGNRVLAAIENPKGKQGTGTSIAQTSNDSGSAAKPSAAKPSAAKPDDSAKEKLIQMPDNSVGYKVGDKFVPQTDKGRGEPVDYNQTYMTGKHNRGLSNDEYKKLAAIELRAAQSGQPYDEFKELKNIRDAELKALNIKPKEPEIQKIEPKAVVKSEPVVTSTSKDDMKTGSWDKVITTKIPPEQQARGVVPESINKEIEDILRLAGKTR